jgi:hypothetical protein
VSAPADPPGVPAMPDNIAPGGWAWPAEGARKAHYFAPGELRSACGSWLYLGTDFMGNPRRMDCCVGCLKNVPAAKP